MGFADALRTFTSLTPWLAVRKPTLRKIRGPSATLGMTQRRDDVMIRWRKRIEEDAK